MIKPIKGYEDKWKWYNNKLAKKSSDINYNLQPNENPSQGVSLKC